MKIHTPARFLAAALLAVTATAVAPQVAHANTTTPVATTTAHQSVAALAWRDWDGTIYKNKGACTARALFLLPIYPDIEAWKCENGWSLFNGYGMILWVKRS